MTPLLELTGISKSFPGVRALDDVRFDLWAGEVHALMGENGAGKSTLIKILGGVQASDTGEIRMDGRPVTIANPVRAHELGISTVHQELHLEPFLTVAENIFLGRLPTNAFGLLDRRRMLREARRILDDLGVSLALETTLEHLSIAERQLVAIARAVSTKARVLIFDEPTSSLSPRETDTLLALIRQLRGAGIGIIYVSHRMEEVLALSDRVTVFRDGRHVATTAIGETSLGALIGMMIGRQLDAAPRLPPAEPGEAVLEVRNLSRRGLLDAVSFVLRRGEIVGVAGLVGAGRTELARALFGDLPGDGGETIVAGVPLRIRTPRQAIAAGIGLVPEDRKEQGLVTGLSVAQNIAMPQLGRLATFGVLDRGRERAVARRYVDRLSIRTPSLDQKAVNLSGGNQQRVVIAKWLATGPKILIVDEPTRGVDVGAKAEIHGLLRDLARAGMAILMISSDLPEVLAVSDRILIMHRGRITGELPAATATQDAIMRHAMGKSVAGEAT